MSDQACGCGFTHGHRAGCDAEVLAAWKMLESGAAEVSVLVDDELIAALAPAPFSLAAPSTPTDYSKPVRVK